jgi:hypothetical protein
MADKRTWFACCQACGLEYFRRAFTDEEREDPRRHPVRRPMICRCGATILLSSQTRWKREWGGSAGTPPPMGWPKEA